MVHNVSKFKEYLKEQRRESVGTSVPLEDYPQWREIVALHPFIINPEDATGIVIISVHTVHGADNCCALCFDDKEPVGFSYKKIGMSVEKALKRRLYQAFSNAKRSEGLYSKDDSFMSLTREFEREHPDLKSQVVDEPDYGWMLPNVEEFCEFYWSKA